MSLEIYFGYGVDDTHSYISDDTNLNGIFNNSLTLTRTSDYKWWTVAGDWIAYTEIQLEEGSVATEFEQRPLSIEQMLCWRYFKRYVDVIFYGLIYDNNSINKSSLFIFDVEMRIDPTVSYTESSNMTDTVTTNIYKRGGFLYGVCELSVSGYWSDVIFDAEF